MAADMWSLSVILFESLTGCRLHAHPTRIDPIYLFFVLSSGVLMVNGDAIPDELFERMNNSNSNNNASSGRGGV
jgi:hypothetical protein